MNVFCAIILMKMMYLIKIILKKTYSWKIGMPVFMTSDYINKKRHVNLIFYVFLYISIISKNIYSSFSNRFYETVHYGFTSNFNAHIVFDTKITIYISSPSN